jgi:CO/xanthine dehydrogenase Mo-binding subunit
MGAGTIIESQRPPIPAMMIENLSVCHASSRSRRKISLGGPLPRGRGRGIARFCFLQRYLAEVGEVSIREDKGRKVRRGAYSHRLRDGGKFRLVRSQTQGAIIYGLGAALKIKVPSRM